MCALSPARSTRPLRYVERLLHAIREGRREVQRGDAHVRSGHTAEHGLEVFARDGLRAVKRRAVEVHDDNASLLRDDVRALGCEVPTGLELAQIVQVTEDRVAGELGFGSHELEAGRFANRASPAVTAHEPLAAERLAARFDAHAFTVSSDSAHRLAAEEGHAKPFGALGEDSLDALRLRRTGKERGSRQDVLPTRQIELVRVEHHAGEVTRVLERRRLLERGRPLAGVENLVEHAAPVERLDGGNVQSPRAERGRLPRGHCCVVALENEDGNAAHPELAREEEPYRARATDDDVVDRVHG